MFPSWYIFTYISHIQFISQAIFFPIFFPDNLSVENFTHQFSLYQKLSLAIAIAVVHAIEMHF